MNGRDAAPGGWGLLFPGQGAQKNAMGTSWRDTEAWSLVPDLSEWSGHDVADLLLTAGDDALRRTDRAQLAVFSLSLLALTHLRRTAGEDESGRLVGAVACAGHSLGELTALVAAGALPMADATRLVAARGAAMLAATRDRPGTMGVVVGAGLDAVTVLVEQARAAGDEVWVANVNAPGQTVVAGTQAGVAAVAVAASREHLKLVPIAVGGAFHSPLMAAALPGLGQALDRARFHGRHLPVVANVDACPYTTGADWPDLLRRQLTSPVRWERSVRVLVDDLGVTAFLEIGHGRVLSGTVRRIAPAVPVTRVGSPQDVPVPLVAPGLQAATT